MIPHRPNSIVILTGAGISAESGLATFRDPDGIWSRYDIQEVATPEAFRRDPARVHGFYNMRRREILSGAVAPNPAHLALAGLERRWPGEVALVTQNIDNLHERAGSAGPIHMHGELLKARCARTGRVFEWAREITLQDRCSCCDAAGTLRPHVVWFGEVPLEMERIHAALRRCALFLAVGTSGSVYPAAGFVELARLNRKARTVELNLERTPLSPLFDEGIYGKAGDIVPAYVERLLASRPSGPDQERGP